MTTELAGVVALLGAGKMGEALLSGLLRAGTPAADLIVTTRRSERGDYLADRYGVQAVDTKTAAERADTLVLAVKPQDMGTLLDELAPVLPSGSLVVSMAAGITTEF